MTPFMEYYISLAPPGETMLIVKQVKSGAMPAFLPAKWKPGFAWYGNTGSYIVDRFTPGKPPSASVANIDHTIGMLFDDVGTKAKEPPLKPTWIMETSPGNYQWFVTYPLDEQPDPGTHCAAQKALAAAGYTDGGAGNAVRNFRLEGSINLKPGKDNFAARLIEFNPNIEMTLAQICEACDVTPGEADTARPALTITDDGKDEVLAWLSKSGQLLSATNAAGWAGTVCPRADRHTDGNIEARYMPSTRSFMCPHEHCRDLDTEFFLDFVAEHGGPNVNAGLRPDLLASTMTAALAKLAPTEAYPDEVAAIVAEVERKQLGREKKAELHERWAYVTSDDTYFDMIERRELARVVFNAVYAHLDCKPNAARWFDAHRDDRGGRVLHGITYAAGDSGLCAHDGDVYGNKWRDSRPEPIPGPVDLWLAHLERMLPDREEREHTLNVLACKLQQPRTKINHAILHASLPGAGKDTLYAPFFWAIGGPSRRNVALVSSETLGSQWGYDLESEVMVINELRQTEGADRRSLENRLKPIIAAPPEYLPVNRKGLHPYNLVNRGLVMAFSNFHDAIALPSNDRRWFVLWSDCGRMPEASARRIWGWYHAGGFAAVSAWLMARDLSKFNPAAAPMQTEAFHLLCEQSLSSAESWLVEQIKRAPEFASGIIGGPFHELLDQLQGRCPPGIKLVQNALFHAFAEAGWRDFGRVKSAEHMSNKRIFCRSDKADMSKSDLRRAVEPPRPVLVLVPTPAPAKEKPA